MSEDADAPNPSTRSGGELSPLDPFISLVVRWIGESPAGVAANGLANAISSNFGWPQPFAEAIVTGLRGRRLLKPNFMSSRPVRLMLSPLGQTWLDDQRDANA